MVYALIAFAAAMLIGLPIALVLGIVSFTHIMTIGPDFLSTIVQRMFSGVNSSSMVCIPFFIVAGDLMNRGGLTEKLFDFMRQTFGFVKGGLAYATVAVGVILSAILGSANAVSAILCKAAVPELERDGYDKVFATSLVAVTGVLGPVIPPSVGFVMLGVLCGVSVKSLFLAGIIPGILLALAIACVIAYYTKKRGYSKSVEHFNIQLWGRSFIKAIPGLMVPLVIIGGVLMGIFTPSEAGAIAALIAIIFGFVYKTMTINDLMTCFMNSALTSAGILLIVAFGNVLGWSMAFDRIPEKLTELMTSISDNPYIVMGMILVALLIIGFFLEGFAAILIFAPIFAPLATSVGIDLVHFCLIFIIMINIGLITPPMGMVLFVSSNITQTPLEKLCVSIWPFVLATFGCTALMAFLPQITLFIPNLINIS